MIEIKEVLASEFMVEHHQMVKDHWTEIDHDVDLNPDVERYQYLEASGILKTLGVFKDDEAIGYCSIAISRHPHSANTSIAIVDAIYISPYSRGLAGGRLIKAAEDLAKQYGASDITWFAKPSSGLYMILNRHGYNISEVALKKKV